MRRLFCGLRKEARFHSFKRIESRANLAFSWLRSGIAVLVFLCVTAPTFAVSSADDYFEQKVRPLLVERCYKCHSSETGKTSGGLALDTKQGWEKGGDSGPAIQPSDPDGSLLVQAIEHRGDVAAMPPEESGPKLTDQEIRVLREWIQKGAVDPRIAPERLGGMTLDQAKSWWSFQNPKLPPVPQLPPEFEAQAKGDIDRFVYSKLLENGLKPAPAASKYELIRRLTYDLTGLPPTVEEVDTFVNDSSETAYANLIDRLLRSPHYGERWGRHWLDLVRYADTAGENSDHPIQDAWRYRNWVIDAFNNDLPYDQFVREQIAGDILHSKDSGKAYANGLVATGYLAIARRFDHDADKHMHLTFEDTLDTMGKSILGLSVGCARCHDHKYDPISTKDYYALYGILQSTRFSFPGCEAKQQPRDMVPLLNPDEWAKFVEPFDRQVAEIDAKIKVLADRQAAESERFTKSIPSEIRTLANGVVNEGATSEIRTNETNQPIETTVARGELLELIIDPQENYGADTTIVEWEIVEVGGEGRIWNLTKDVVDNFLAGNPHADSYQNSSSWLFLDARNGLSLLPETVSNLQGQNGLYVWRKGDNPSVLVNSNPNAVSVWTNLPAKTLFVHPASDGPVAIGWMSPIEGKVLVRGKVQDGHPGGPNGVGWTLKQIPGSYDQLLAEMTATNLERNKLAKDREALMATAPQKEFAYAAIEGTPANAKQHLRGDPEKLGDEIPRRWLELFGGASLPADAGSGRLQLADWLTSKENPLTSRVIVNRIWQHHFGKGIVATPNDFGSRGQLPTHPELLDYLASRFVAEGWSIKKLHREILLSATYRQNSRGDADIESIAYEKDPNNTLYWKMDRRRLSAEELRDTLLSASGQIDLTPGAAHPLPPTPTWSFTQHGPFASFYETDKRSVYVITLRNRRHPFFALFDGADPNATTPQRQVSTVPTQSLYFLNDPFFHDQTRKIAEKLPSGVANDHRINELFRNTLQRNATTEELNWGNEFLTGYMGELTEGTESERAREAWNALTRVLLSGNEFLYVE